MEAQYYVPTIEEFHVGFEYQLCSGFETPSSDDEDWVNFVFGVLDIYDFDDQNWAHNLSEYINKKLVHVKHLDRQDIEECGWTQRDHDTYDIEGYALEFNSEYKTFIYHTGPRHGTVFKGNIRNKSQLKRIMQQCGISSQTEKVKCDCYCHKSNQLVMHVVACCDNGYVIKN